MRFSYFGFVAIAVALLNFPGNSNAAITSELSEMAEIEKLVTTREYQDKQEAIIMNSSDEDSKAAKDAIQAIRRGTSMLRAAGVSQGPANSVLESILTAVRIVSKAERLAIKAFHDIKKLATKDPKAAIEALRKSINSIEELIFTFGIPVEDIFGSALARAGGENQLEVQKAMSAMQSAGTAMLECVKMAEKIAIKGIEAGGSAIISGLKAAHDAVVTGGSAAFAYHYNGAKSMIRGSSRSVLNVPNQTNRVTGIIQSLRTQVSINDPAASAAINSLKNSLKSKLNARTTQTGKDSAKILGQALTSTILETAEAIAVAKKALKEAKKLANHDKEAAIAAIQKAIKAARDEVVHGSSIGFLGFGAAREIAVGVEIDILTPAMLEIIIGRVAAYDDLQIAQEIAITGIQAGVAGQGIDAAISICEAAGNALYIQFVESGNIGFSIFLSN